MQGEDKFTEEEDLTFDSVTGEVSQSGFEKHGLTHSSASQINQWAEAPHMWLAQYLFNRKGVFGAAPKAGMLVEDAVVAVLARGFTAEAAIQHAVNQYNQFITLSGTDTDRKRGNALPGMILGALEALAPYGVPVFDGIDERGKLKQQKVDVLCRGEGFDINVTGFLDFVYPAHGVVVDLKTSMKMPSDLSDAHRRQGCIYRKAMGNQAVKFLYVTGAKFDFIDVPEPAETLAEIKGILTRQNKFLLAGDKDFLRDIVPVVSSSYYHDAGIAKELFNV